MAAAGDEDDRDSGAGEDTAEGAADRSGAHDDMARRVRHRHVGDRGGHLSPPRSCSGCDLSPPCFLCGLRNGWETAAYTQNCGWQVIAHGGLPTRLVLTAPWAIPAGFVQVAGKWDRAVLERGH